MQIHGASHVHGPHSLQGPHSARQNQATSSAKAQTVDQLDISAEAAAASDAADIRTDLVSRLKSEIASGTYETPDKLDHAVSRLLDEIG